MRAAVEHEPNSPFRLSESLRGGGVVVGARATAPRTRWAEIWNGRGRLKQQQTTSTTLGNFVAAGGVVGAEHWGAAPPAASPARVTSNPLSPAAWLGRYGLGGAAAGAAAPRPSPLQAVQALPLPGLSRAARKPAR